MSTKKEHSLEIDTLTTTAIGSVLQDVVLDHIVECIVEIVLLDVNDNAPVFQGAMEFQVEENSSRMKVFGKSDLRLLRRIGMYSCRLEENVTVL